jgi:predicted O-linked N-acetylglucosamine transferase (SPINDLY family)
VLKRNAFRDESVRNRVLSRFADHGIIPERIELLPFSPSRVGHLSHYARLDIALDTFPYNGATTTCEALWMGVPVVSWYGRTHATRVGLSLLTALGLGELACSSHDEYVARVVALARAPERIRVLRHTLRDRLLSSPVCDKLGFVRELESVYRDMWRTWCNNRSVDFGAEALSR